MSNSPSSPDDLLCQCYQVPRAEVEQIIRSGERNVNRIGEYTGAGMGCRTCKTQIARMVRAILQVEPDWSIELPPDWIRGPET